MTSNLSDIKFGSPLPDMAQKLGEEIIKGRIAIPNTLWDLHIQSNVQLRPMTELDMALTNTLNGSWTYVPKYLGPARAMRQAYSLGRTVTSDEPRAGYELLLNQMTRQAEQQFFYKPLGVLRDHLLIDGKIRMPKRWHVEIGPKFALTVASSSFELFLNQVDHQEMLRTVYDMLSSALDNNDPANASHVVCSDSSRGPTDVHVLNTQATPPASSVNMTNIFRFLLHPIGHDLTQDRLQDYLESVNN
ncbi:hypothetical protein pEaSNUABM34_00075 [Erwinia phage pEa_SNUABM_34]|nr:hypothetical protein pEaSNUABM34_00075 [Erwinia phage pEa_SNUABM_34]